MSKAFENKPAFPVTQAYMDIGMTLLEHFAGLAMQGLLSNDQMAGSHSQYAEESVAYAKALIAELEKEPV